MAELLELSAVSVSYERRGGGPVHAVKDVTLSVGRGEIVGLVGESGCGKSSLGRAAVGLVGSGDGRVTFEGESVGVLGRGARAASLRRLQMVFQDPYSSLNPRRRIGDQVADGLRLSADRARAAKTPAVAPLLERVGLPADASGRYPHEFSGGQRQRIAIARALAAGPTCLVADEPISALDASAQAQVANLLVSLARDLNMGMLFISHDLAVVRQIAERTAVMYLGRLVEVGPTATVWEQPGHPYTQALVSAIPRPDGLSLLPTELPGDVPDPSRPPPGCRFHPRCSYRRPGCDSHEPTLVSLADGRKVACVLQSEAKPVQPLVAPGEHAGAASPA